MSKKNESKSGISKKPVLNCCSVDNSNVVDSRTAKSKGYKTAIPPKVRVRIRICKTCDREFVTYEGELVHLFNGYQDQFEGMG